MITKCPLPPTLECVEKYFVNAEEVIISMQRFCLIVKSILFWLL